MQVKSGFTLFELLIVLAIMAMVLGIFVLRGSGGGRTLSFHAVADELALALRSARIQALSTGQPASVTIDSAQRRWRSATGAIKTLPAGIALSIIATAPQIESPTVAGIAFLPDGSASGGKISIMQDKRRIDIDVTWLTGSVAVSDVQ